MEYNDSASLVKDIQVTLVKCWRDIVVNNLKNKVARFLPL